MARGVRLRLLEVKEGGCLIDCVRIGREERCLFD